MPLHTSHDDDLLNEEPFYIHTHAAPASERDLVLKYNDTFAVVDRYGDMRHVGLAEHGLYHDGTRYLSSLVLRIGHQRPLLLSSAVTPDNAWLAADLTNPDLLTNGTIVVARGLIHISRRLVVANASMHMQLVIRSFSQDEATIPLVVRFGADYADIFEVRGTERARRGDVLDPQIDRSGVLLAYRGLDGVARRTRIAIDPPPARLTHDAAMCACRLAPQQEERLSFAFVCEEEKHERSTARSFAAAVDVVTHTLRHRRDAQCTIATSHQQFNRWLDRSFADLAMMIGETPYGPYPYAGVPWFSTPFGRDGIITALESLWVAPELARGVLTYLAATQARTIDPAADAQPGKILHETRRGEMADLAEIPFARYYGSEDATPLFLLLAAEYYRATNDAELIAAIWPAIQAAATWIDRYGDLDGDGLLEYARQSSTGLVHQGWKDSHDAISHHDGTLAEGPIALCEVQAYVYAAWRGMAALAGLMGQHDAHSWLERAEALRVRFEQRFWLPDLDTYAIALDGAKRPCAVRASNAGHALFARIASPERAARVARSLMAPSGFSGWGVRTLAASEARYNPMSYHNGSVWPHDNAIIASGFSHYGLRDEALALLTGMFDASIHFDLHRLPELFCGFSRHDAEGPVSYPVACNPQAWASASVFLLLQAALGLDVDAAGQVVRFTRARLPLQLEQVWIRDLRVGASRLDLRLERHEHDVGITVLRREGHVEIVSVK